MSVLRASLVTSTVLACALGGAAFVAPAAQAKAGEVRASGTCSGTCSGAAA